MFEYKTLAMAGHPEALLNAHGRAGWELVGVAPLAFDRDGRCLHNTLALFLKRPLPQPVDPGPSGPISRPKPAGKKNPK